MRQVYAKEPSSPSNPKNPKLLEATTKAQSFNRKSLGPKNRRGAEAPKASTPAALKSLHLSSVVLRLTIGGLGVYRV